MANPAVDHLFRLHPSKLVGSTPIETSGDGTDAQTSLYFYRDAGSISFRIESISESQNPPAILPVSLPIMAQAIRSGRPYLPHIYSLLHLTNPALATPHDSFSTRLPEIFETLQTEFGNVHLRLPEAHDASFVLSIKIKRRGEKSINKEFPISPLVIADSIDMGLSPLRGALEKCPDAIALLTAHDNALKAAAEADDLYTASNKGTNSSAPTPKPTKPRSI